MGNNPSGAPPSTVWEAGPTAFAVTLPLTAEPAADILQKRVGRVFGRSGGGLNLGDIFLAKYSICYHSF